MIFTVVLNLGNQIMYCNFLSFPKTTMAQFVDIFPHGKLGFVYPAINKTMAADVLVTQGRENNLGAASI